MKLKNAVVISVVVILITAGWVYAIDFKPPGREVARVDEPTPRASEPVQEETGEQKENQEKETHLKISVIGDCTLGYDYRYQNYFGQTLADQGNDYGYFFANVRPLLAGDDLTIANMEGTFTNSSEPGDKGDPAKCYYFKGPPEYVKILSQGSVEAVNLANNHSLDYMEAGHADTKTALAGSNITYFGYENRPIIDVKGVRIGLLGYNLIGPVLGDGGVEDYKQALEQDIGRMKGDADLVMVGFHWGQEGSYNPDSDQTVLGRYAIDLGADLVMGDHPHVIQPVEEYKGKYIIYSLGNFCFGGNRYPGDFDSFIFQQDYDIWKGGPTVQVKAARPVITPVSISSAEGVNNFQPTPVDNGESAFSKLHWQP